MANIVWLDYPESEFSQALAGLFQDKGWEVVTAAAEDAGKYADHVDLAVLGQITARTADSLKTGFSYDAMIEQYEKIAVAPMVKLQFLLPLLDRGAIKRICFLTDSTASINQSEDTCAYASAMAYAALHNHAVIAYNKLQADGYTLRVMDPRGPLPLNALAGCAYATFTRNRGYDPHNDARIDERVPKMVNYRGAVVPW